MEVDSVAPGLRIGAGGAAAHGRIAQLARAHP